MITHEEVKKKHKKAINSLIRIFVLSTIVSYGLLILYYTNKQFFTVHHVIYSILIIFVGLFGVIMFWSGLEAFHEMTLYDDGNHDEYKREK
jgi:glucan phosphoethanolaminetransferase (alkaline phosphatase superfamily)